MSAVRAKIPQSSALGTKTEAPAQKWQCGTASFTARWGRSGGIVTVDGEIDAANADEFTDYLHECATYCEWLALDLSKLEFIGTTGFAALRSINARFAQTGVRWALVPGTAVTRLLSVCSPNNALPMAESVADALTTLQNPERLLRPVPHVS